MEVTAWHLLDLLLALLLPGLAWSAISTRDLRRGVVLFIAFGLLLSLVWARLRAPDLALAEAAIGAGLSGALLLSALRDAAGNVDSHKGAAGRKLGVGLLSLGLAGTLAWAWFAAVHGGAGERLAGVVMDNIGESGVSNPVTAVLLNFRAYDTLLELAVLLAAALGIMALGPARRPFGPAEPLLASLIRWLVPLLILVAGYLLWVGAHAPGGAFQAGALLGAVVVLLRLGGFAGAGLPSPALQRWLLGGGIAAFVLVGSLVTLPGLAFLQYPQGWAGTLILLIESAAMLSIALALGLAYLGGHPVGWLHENNRKART
ncbi:MAG: DUF4040 domain-containing protein [Gammaproteobacteria bacterium]